jgi:membrane-associated phospholipid phosphatase
MGTASQESFLSLFWRRARPLDKLTCGYIFAFAVGLLLFGRHQPSTKFLLPVNAGLLAAIVWTVVRWNDRTHGAAGFFRQLYPAILYTFFYCEIAVALHWIFPGFFDAQILALERAVLGVDLNVWLIPLQRALLNEWMMLGYFSYYLVIACLALVLFFQMRIEELHDFLTAVTVTFVISYTGFILYPVAGPRYFLAEHFSNPIPGWCFVPLVNWIIASGAIHGGCMPSSHVAVALVVLVWAYRTNRRLAVVMTPFILTLFFATVWGRFHYFSDVVVGWLVGAAGLRLAAWWCAAGNALVKARSRAALNQVPATS